MSNCITASRANTTPLCHTSPPTPPGQYAEDPGCTDLPRSARVAYPIWGVQCDVCIRCRRFPNNVDMCKLWAQALE